jgi:hypothetical protein
MRFLFLALILPTLLFSSQSSLVVIDWVNKFLEPLSKQKNILELLALEYENKGNTKAESFKAVKEGVDADLKNFLLAQSGILRIDVFNKSQILFYSYPSKNRLDVSKETEIVSNAFSSDKIQVTPTFFDQDLGTFIILVAIPTDKSSSSAGIVLATINAGTFTYD